MKCPHCGNEAQDDAIFCDQCGTRLKPAAAPAAAPQPAASPTAGAVCPSCGHVNTPGEMFCSECGARLAAPQPEPATVTQAAAPAAPVTPSTEGRTCPACGASVAPNEDFCYACGADLRAPAAATPVAAPQPQPAPAPTATPPETAAQVASAAESECPACGAKVKPGDTFCEFCGAALVKAEAPAVQPAPAAPATAAAPTASAAPQPRLVVVASGVEIPLPAGQEVLVGREDPYSNVFPDVDLTPHGGEEGGVSRRHFKISHVGGQYLVEDLNSTNFTLLNRQRLQPGTPAKLADGDEIRAGRVRLIFRVS